MDFEMGNMVFIAGGTLVIPILAFMASFLLWPSALIRVYYWYWRRALGLQVHYADCGSYRFCYSTRGKPGTRPSILMLHGFSTHKDMWLSVAKFLPKHLHLVCVDMPGHEGTTRTNAEDYCIEGQVKRIHQFVESIQLNKKPFHLVGTSMGGNVAGVYAARYPADVSGLSLICPAGLKQPHESNFVKHLRVLEKTQNIQSIPLIPSTPQEMDDMIKLVSHIRYKIPQQILQGLVDVRIPHNDFYREAFLEIVGENSRYSLHENMHMITAPVQVIWGKQDQVVDVSGASVLEEALPGCQVELLENCGHSVPVERPRKLAKLIMDFLIAQQNVSNGSSKKLS
ncbi:monoacylglycerol lipase ABHD6-like [Megalops cyprinoides]|uniref:monoacylglycerol lipase ABHD6-like n=1 Tax=Megalops cyprinoides TaxID=118141 RepID=UPI001864BB24|nr:monoacylglycerol lipase ABHD6-like [Megalops cyprinoides]